MTSTESLLNYSATVIELKDILTLSLMLCRILSFFLKKVISQIFASKEVIYAAAREKIVRDILW